MPSLFSNTGKMEMTFIAFALRFPGWLLFAGLGLSRQWALT